MKNIPMKSLRVNVVGAQANSEFKEIPAIVRDLTIRLPLHWH
jgi:hypothetical protein